MKKRPKRLRLPNVVFIDIETSPARGWYWQRYETDILHEDQPWQLLSFAYKEPGKPTKCLARPNFKGKSDKALTKAAWEILDSADILIGHNLDRFDNRKLRAKFVEHGLKPPRPYKTIDTLKIARSQFGFMSNKLNDLAETLKLGRKINTGGFRLWLDCMAGDPAAWRKMIAYNKHDVVLLELVYNRLKSWYPNHPSFSMYEDLPACPVCRSNTIQRRGFNVARTKKTPRFHCQDCGYWFSNARLAKQLAAF